MLKGRPLRPFVEESSNLNGRQSHRFATNLERSVLYVRTLGIILTSLNFKSAFSVNYQTSPLVSEKYHHGLIINFAIRCARRDFRNLSNASLASISRTNKSFHNTVERALYEHIRMTMIIEPNYHGSRYQHSSRVFQYPPVHLLPLSVWNRPKLAEYIKHVEFQCQSRINHSDPVICNFIPEPVFTEQETRSLFDFLHIDFFLQKGMTKKVKKEWIRSITKPGPPNDAQVALLISQLPNLKTLTTG